MELNEYQELALRTMSPEGDAANVGKKMAMVVAALGLAGEGGECADLMKKVLAHGHKFDHAFITKFAAEVGDCLWYCAAAAKAMGMDLNYIASQNVQKLQSRYPESFSSRVSEERYLDESVLPPGLGSERQVPEDKPIVPKFDLDAAKAAADLALLPRDPGGSELYPHSAAESPMQMMVRKQRESCEPTSDEVVGDPRGKK